jgi:LPXTG-site transpeptidase (sortase) family protein
MRLNQLKLRLFAGTFVSSLLLIFGLSTLALMFAPVIVNFFSSNNYQPSLPLAAERADAFLNINSIDTKQPFPPIAQATEVAEGNWIRIPSIGVNVPLAESPSLGDKDVLATLDRGAALYPNGILPGRIGNTFISAHSTGEPWKGKYRFAFLKIDQIKPGHVIHLDYSGTRYTYKVTHNRIVKPLPDFYVRSDRPVPTVSLMACWPLWSTNERMLIHGELTNITHLATPAT